MARAGIALGSNLGDRLANLRAARDSLADLSPDPASLRSAPIYQTAPVLCPDGSPDFFNTVIEIETRASPLELLHHTQAIERRLGRPAHTPRNAPRTIDVDLLYLGATVFESPDLTLPHPRLALRRFVLVPLAALDPELVLPGHPASIAGLLAALASPEPLPTLVHPVW
jgi:2-amino-4-hydroxy-6-hydroxymethyldihydropteridine diphosphokinase